jgi:hypothetical protein
MDKVFIRIQACRIIFGSPLIRMALCSTSWFSRGAMRTLRNGSSGDCRRVSSMCRGGGRDRQVAELRYCSASIASQRRAPTKSISEQPCGKLAPATSRRERQMQRSKSSQQAQDFLSAHSFIYGHFHPRRRRLAVPYLSRRPGRMLSTSGIIRPAPDVHDDAGGSTTLGFMPPTRS